MPNSIPRGRFAYHPVHSWQRADIIARAMEPQMRESSACPSSSIEAALTTQEVKDRLSASGVEVRTSTPAEFARLIESDIVKWAKVVKDSGAKVD